MKALVLLRERSRTNKISSERASKHLYPPIHLWILKHISNLDRWAGHAEDEAVMPWGAAEGLEIQELEDRCYGKQQWMISDGGFK